MSDHRGVRPQQFRDLYITKAAIKLVSTRYSPRVLDELRVYQLRLADAIEKVKVYSHTYYQSDRLEAFDGFQQGL